MVGAVGPAFSTQNDSWRQNRCLNLDATNGEETPKRSPCLSGITSMRRRFFEVEALEPEYHGIGGRHGLEIELMSQYDKTCDETLGPDLRETEYRWAHKDKGANLMKTVVNEPIRETLRKTRYSLDFGSRLSPRPFSIDNMGSSHGADDNGGESGEGDSSSGTATISKPKSETKTPSLYRVILMNDDFTPMDFVIHVLQKFFNKDYTEATKIMLQVHQQGAGVCGVFSYEIAETKVYQVNQYSRQNRHPLKCTMEKV